MAIYRIAGSALALALVFAVSPAKAQCTVDGNPAPVSCNGDVTDNLIVIDGIQSEIVNTGAGRDEVVILSSGGIETTVPSPGIGSVDGDLTVSGGGHIKTTEHGPGIAAVGVGDVVVRGIDINTRRGDGILESSDGTVFVEEATISVNDASTFFSFTASGVTEQGNGDINVTNSTVFSRPQHGLWERGGGDIHVTGSTISSVAGFGIIEVGAGDVHVTDSLVFSNGDWGLAERDAGDVRIINSTVYSTFNYGLYENGEGDVSVTGSIVYSTANYGLFEDGAGDVHVTDSTVYSNGNWGLVEDGAGDVHITDSTVYSTANYGVAEYDAGDVFVTNATVYSDVKYGIVEDGNGDVAILDSTVFSNGDAGVSEDGQGDVRVTNSTVYSTADYGVEEQGDGDAVIVNSLVYSDLNHGVKEDGPGNVVVRNSTVYSHEYYGITASGPGNVLVRNSTVYSTRDHAIRITSDGGKVSILGSRVYTTDTNERGLALSGSGSTVHLENSHISGDFAMTVSGDDNLFRISSGTNLEGAITNSGTGNIFEFGPGYNGILTFNTLPDTFRSGNPLVISGNTVAVADITGFAATDKAVGDMTRTIAATLEERMGLAGPAGGYSSSFGADLSPESAGPASPATAAGWWGSGFGGGRDADENDWVAPHENRFAGAMAGYDWAHSSGVAGLFGGYAVGEIVSQHDAYKSDMTSWFGGGYYMQRINAAFVDFSLFGGMTEFDSARLVNNNLVVGGVETAEAGYDGWWISPSLRAGHDFAAPGGVLTPSARLRYAGLFLDDYAETGSAAAMSVEGRNAHIVELRGELAYSFAPMPARSGSWDATLRVGVDGIFGWGDDVEATLLGTAIVFAPGEDDTLARGYIGAAASYNAANGLRVAAGVEAGYDTVGAFDLSGNAMLAVAF